MHLSVLPNVNTPAYRQIYEQIRDQILSGRLTGGTALPPIRTVAVELGVSVITVRGAWEALEKDGLIETRAGSGCYVAALSESERIRRCDEVIQEPAKRLLHAAKQLGLSEAALMDRLRTLWNP